MRKKKARLYPVRFIDNQKVIITKAKFLEIRESPDFLAAVSIGRMLNALTFSMSLVIEHGSMKTARQRRSRIRSFQIMASNLHEAVGVLASLRETYRNEPFFQNANEIIYPKDDSAKSRRSAIMKKIRDSSGFHLDQEKKYAPKTLARLHLSEYVLLSGDGDTAGDFYFDFADTLDLNYWIDEFRGERSERETLIEISKAVGSLNAEIISVSHQLLLVLLQRLGIAPDRPAK